MMPELGASSGHVGGLYVLDLYYYVRYPDFGIAESALAWFGPEVSGV